MAVTLSAFSNVIADLVCNALPATVTIFGESRDLAIGGSGSGWIFDNLGHVVTNYHVIEDLAHPIRVKPAGLPHVIGTVIGVDPATDLAVLSISTKDLTPLHIRSSPARLGEICIAIGSPLGLRESASMGIISGLSRQKKHPDGYIIEEMLQTDASVNPGNSGGPLIDTEGQLLGVNTLGNGETVNFAVPAETVGLIVPELIKFGSIARGSLGISVSAKWTMLDGKEEELIEVQSIRSEEINLMPGDLLLSIDSNQIKRRIDVQRALSRKNIGRRLPIQIMRNGTQIELEVIPKERLVDQ